MFVLDTNVVSELRKAGDGRADLNMVAWLSRHDAAAFFISALTVIELEIGVRGIECRDQLQDALLRDWFNKRVLPEFDGRILPVDTTVTLRCARIHVPDPRSERDALTAATAIEHGMMVVPRNVTDFRDCSVPLVDPWRIPA